eukprot:76297-Chlamydomonas_euryale.AAC.11
MSAIALPRTAASLPANMARAAASSPRQYGRRSAAQLTMWLQRPMYWSAASTTADVGSTPAQSPRNVDVALGRGASSFAA